MAGQTNTNDVRMAIRLENVTKRFGKVVANDGISLSVRKGEILSVLGENGSGKTTLMNMLSGIYFPDEGKIFVDGKEAVIRSPKDAYALGIGMVHQHFKLVDVLTAAENIVLGLPGDMRLHRKKIAEEIRGLTDAYGFELDPFKKIYDMSVSEKQTVEIVKVLYRGANILILDEPTAVLTPQETEKLFLVLWKMRNAGKSVIIITHKLQEVLEISDYVAVLRKGKFIGEVETGEASVQSLTEMMVGEKVSLSIERTEPKEPKKRLVVEHLTCFNHDGVKALNDVSFTAYSGEILGIAGIAGSGQKELLETIAGLHRITEGTIEYFPQDGSQHTLSGMKARQIRALGVHMAFVPEDRLGMGLVGHMDMTDNMMLRSYTEGHSLFVDRNRPRHLAKSLIEQLSINTPGVSAPVGTLSGGNVQKVLVGREIASHPEVFMVAYPVRGLDINSSYTIYRLLNEQKQKGVALICVIEDLDVILELCDRVLVMNAGRITGLLDARSATKEEIGMLMTQGENVKVKKEDGTFVNASESRKE